MRAGLLFMQYSPSWGCLVETMQEVLKMDCSRECAALTAMIQSICRKQSGGAKLRSAGKCAGPTESYCVAQPGWRPSSQNRHGSARDRGTRFHAAARDHRAGSRCIRLRLGTPFRGTRQCLSQVTSLLISTQDSRLGVRDCPRIVAGASTFCQATHIRFG